jgi:hypothetical protein
MDSTELSSGQWTEICREAFAQTGVDRPGFAEGVIAQLAQRVGEMRGASVARAFVEGACELARYASEELKDGEDSLNAEGAAVAASRRIVLPSLQAKLQRRVDQIDGHRAGVPAPCPQCGNRTESEGRPGRSWRSLLGPLWLKRRYSYCDACDCGVSPAQRALGLPDGEFTARFEEVCTMIATTVPHGMATNLVDKLCGIDVSIKAMQDMVERRGAAVLAADQVESRLHAPLDDKGLPVAEQKRPAEAPPPNAAPDVAYVELDGVVPITREELTGKDLSAQDRRRQRRAKEQKARGGKARRYRIVGREVKNAVLYDGHNCAVESPSRGCLLQKTYVSHLGDWASFALLLWVALLRLRFDQAKLLVILSDGSDWIRSLAAWLPIETLLILDLYHVKHRIFEVAYAVFGERTPRARAWAIAQGDRIEAGNVTHVIQALSFLNPRRKETRKLVEDLKGYLTNNRDRMKYPDYRARGLRISSAAVESANFHVTGTRLKLQGMRWSADGAAQMAALRADLFNGRWEQRTRQLLTG